MSRKTDRKHAFNLVFQMQFRQDVPTGELIERYFEREIFRVEEIGLGAGADRDYINETLTGVRERAEEIDGEIAMFARGWELERLVKTDLAILRLAVYELLHSDGVPPKVAINEAVELSKLYSGDESPAFVNGLLGQIAKAHGI
ncbi:MAG: transcription antitermination factor NusB [Defluviitaleaceae bacterium]|nr:transcription antitermination factor NusB [Defluviitaleaceae bacterium]MCL2836755.1 transcription antitermination factor NusB [Defluviitaleaceae bacterium]